jgi:hypothetical protein
MRGTEFDHFLKTLRECNPADENSRNWVGKNILRDSDFALMLAHEDMIPWQSASRYENTGDAMLMLSTKAESIVMCVAEIDNRHGNEISDWLPISIRKWLDRQLFPCLLFGRHHLGPLDLSRKKVSGVGALREPLSWCSEFQNTSPIVTELIRQFVVEMLDRELILADLETLHLSEKPPQSETAWIDEREQVLRQLREVQSMVMEKLAGSKPEFATATDAYSWFAKNRIVINSDEIIIGVRTIPLKNQRPREIVSYMHRKLIDGVRIISVKTAFADLGIKHSEANPSGFSRVFFQGPSGAKLQEQLLEKVGRGLYQLYLPELDQMVASLDRKTPA